MIERPYSIYKITCLENGKCYIGMTCRKISARWASHLSWTRNSKRAKSGIVGAIDEYGPDAFKIEVLATAINRQEAAAIERGLIAQCGTMAPSGYNIRPGGEGPREYSDHAKKRMSQSAKLRGPHQWSKESKKRASVSRLAIMTDEMRAAIGRAHKGKKVSAETVAKCRATKAANKAARQSMG